MIDDLDSDFKRAQYLQNMLISEATDGSTEDREYQLLIVKLISIDSQEIKKMSGISGKGGVDMPIIPENSRNAGQ